MKNEVFLDFCIWGFEDITPEQITQALGMQPTKVYIKGQKKNPKFAAVAKQNGWRMNSGLDKHASFEDQMMSILDIIEPRIDLFRPFCEKYYCEIVCAVNVYYDNDESTPSIHLDARYNRLIKELNLEFDVDLYCLPNDQD